jgi:hypothetical protein
MAFVIAISVLLIAVYAYIEAAVVRATQWRLSWAFLYFCLIGLGLAVCAFSLTNYCLMFAADNKESRGWHELLGMVSCMVGCGYMMVMIAATSVFRRRLALKSVGVGAAAMFSIMCGALLWLSRYPQCNWW